MKYLLLFILISCASLQDKNFEKFLDQKFEENIQESPISATFLGRKIHYDKLDDLSEKKAIQNLERFQRQLTELRHFSYDQLSEENQLNYQMYEMYLLFQIETFPYRYHRYHVNQMRSLHSNFPAFMMNQHSIANIKEAKDYIARVIDFKRISQETVNNLESSAKTKVIAPHFIYKKVLRDIKNLKSGYPFSSKSHTKNILYQDFNAKITTLDISADVKSELLKELSLAIKNQYAEGLDLIKNKMIALSYKAPAQGGLSRLPKGSDYYKMLLKFHTTTDLSAEEIHQIGLSEIKRIQDEMKEIMKQVKFKGSLNDFFEVARKDEKFQYPNNDQGRAQYLADTQKVIDEMYKHLDRMFKTKPKAKLIVKAVEKYREKSAGIAFYERPTPDGSKPGIYYVNLSNMEDVKKNELEALAYHEAIPGHHMQISIAMEQTGLPQFRRVSYLPAYSEGWGLYSEYLPKEFGFYRDPYSDFGRLSMEIWRAARLVVDTGIHHKGWTREKAINYLAQNTPGSLSDCEKAIERYIVMPGQATAYKIGQLKILELKKLAEKNLGSRFDIREFHDLILLSGPIPLNILEQRVRQWIEQKS